MRSALALVLILTLFAQPLVAQELHPVAHANPAITVNVDAAANGHPIDPRIYGASWASAAEVAASD